MIAPAGGIAAELGGESRPMLLTLSEIERFEEQYSPIGVFDVLGRFIDKNASPQVRHCRDLVILGLVGGGMGEKAANKLVTGLPMTEQLTLRMIAQRLLFKTFIPAPEEVDSPPESGDEVKPSKVDTTSPKKSETS